MQFLSAAIQAAQDGGVTADMLAEMAEQKQAIARLYHGIAAPVRDDIADGVPV